MPFKSLSQIKKFHMLKSQGKISQATIDQWMDETGDINKLPERITKKAFWSGFTKQSSIKRLGNIVFLKGKPSHVESAMGRVMQTQKPKFIKKIRKMVHGNPSSRELGEFVNGTFGKGKKGSKSYINMNEIMFYKNRHGDKHILRDVVNHEEFHRKVPILGRSEILAYLYGGLKSKKNELSFKKGFGRSYNYVKNNPYQAALEGVLPSMTGYIGYKLHKLYKEHKDMKKEAFIKRMTKVVEHNQDNPEKQKNVRLTYKKLNGRTVKRKILPLSIKGNVVVAHDHKRDAIRSFKIERIKQMEKAASFWGGFKKRASFGHAAEIAGLATLAAPTIAHMAGKPMKEKHKNVAELAGLGILAAPAVHSLFAKAFKGLK